LFNETTRTLDGARTQSLAVPMMVLITKLYITGIYSSWNITRVFSIFFIGVGYAL